MAERRRWQTARRASRGAATCRRPTCRPSSRAPIYERWLAADVFAPDGAGSRADRRKPPFVIIQPPPNVTGSLHLGHAQRTAVEDLMIRHARMQGRPALFLPGLDHASIAAQFVLDRIIAAEGETRASLGRERYLERMWRFIDETRDVILGQQRRLGASLDWGRLRFTMDDGLEPGRARGVPPPLPRGPGLPRRGARSTGAPAAGRASRDLEVIPTPETGTLWTIRYHLVDEATGADEPDAFIAWRRPAPRRSSATPAVAVHPDDPRYAALVGRTRADPVRRAGRPDHRRRGRRPGVRDRRGEDHARPTTTTTTRPASATACRSSTSCDDDGAHQRSRRPLRRPGPRTTPGSGSWPTSRPRGDLVGQRGPTR